ncbi:uncharacterized protein LOC131695078 isoform X1 [Topomyia yanbarensis]|uniref:uncharacterized protein LOC131695078 isoform X1 n=1 Tax=Topomyia yanbarensis TaxID=2498891 RepID=UPI00273C1EFA|nr:uncharacterized protein LOC131695078 isoform X1 [Topomyia yanbarensis]
MKKDPFPASPPTREVPEILDESRTVAGAGNPGPSRVSSNSTDTRSEPSVAPYLPSGSSTKPATLTSKLKVHEETIRPEDGNNKTCSPRSKKSSLSVSPPTREVPESSDESPTVAGTGNPGPSRVSSYNLRTHLNPTAVASTFSPETPTTGQRPSERTPAADSSPLVPLISTRPIQMVSSRSPTRNRSSTSPTPLPDGTNCTLAIQWNTNGLRANLGDLQRIIARSAPICLAIQETHINHTDPSPWFSYRYIWESAKGSNIYQTVVLGTRADLPSEPVKFDTDLIVVGRKINFPISCTVASICIPQEVSNVGNKLRNLFKQLHTPFLLMGYFNAHSVGFQKVFPSR